MKIVLTLALLIFASGCASSLSPEFWRNSARASREDSFCGSSYGAMRACRGVGVDNWRYSK